MQKPKVLLLLSNGFEAFEAAVFTDILGWSSEDNGPQVEIISCGIKPLLRCTWGFSVQPDLLLSEVNVADYDALAIPGGFETAGFYTDAYSPEFATIINAFAQQNKWIATICVAALALGHAGILKNRHATTYQLNPLRLEQLAAFGANLQPGQIVIDDKIITSSNPATATEVAFTLLEKVTTAENRHRVSRLMGFS